MNGNQARLRDARLVGAGVVVRPVRTSDAPAAFTLIHGREEVTRTLAWNGPDEVRDLEQSFAEWNPGSEAGGVNYLFAIEAEGKAFVGGISLRFEGHPFVGDVGYWLGSDYWNRGITTEANRLVAHLAFEGLEARALTATVFVGNDASARLLEKVGYQREVNGRGVPVVGRPTELDRDSWAFAMTPLDFRRGRGEWRPRRTHVELQ